MSRKGTTKSGGRKDSFDKFYTKASVARRLISTINLNDYSLIIEPSAGNGAFSSQIQNCVAMDIAPEYESIIKQNFFTYQPPAVNGKILVIGNPPFGVQNNLAIRFFNHAASFADTIAFVLPRSFRKDSIQHKLNLSFSLTAEEPLNHDSYIFEGVPYSVPSVFQIWNKTTTPRLITPIPTLNGVRFVNRENSPHLCFQRVGGNAGTVGVDCANKSEHSHYFLQVDDPHFGGVLLNALENKTWEGRDDTVGPRSISKRDLIFFIKSVLDNYGSA